MAGEEGVSYFDKVLEIGRVNFNPYDGSVIRERDRIHEWLEEIWFLFEIQTGEELSTQDLELVVSCSIENSRKAFVTAYMASRPECDDRCDAHDTSYNNKHFPSHDFDVTE